MNNNEKLISLLAEAAAALTGAAAELSKVTPEPVAPEPAPLRYKVGDYVMVPFRVTAIIPQDTEEPYRAENLNDPDTFAYNFTRRELEPEVPAVGDTCLFWDTSFSCMVTGKLTAVLAHNTYPYEYNDGERFQNCLKLS